MKKVAWWLLIIGGINWGLVGFGSFFNADWNVVTLLLGKMPIIEYIVYVLVGVSAIVCIFGCKSCKDCKDGKCDIHGSETGNMGNGPTM